MHRQVFVSQPGMGQMPSNMTPELSHNLMVIEISNNWILANELVDNVQKGKISEIDLLEKDWLDFLNKNSINIQSYKNGDEFIDKNLKTFN